MRAAARLLLLARRRVAFAAGHRRACTPLAASRGLSSERDGLLRGVRPEHRTLCALSLERAEAAVGSWGVALTAFLEPPEAEAVRLAVGRLADADARPWGGHAHAERVRLRLGRPEVLDADDPLAALRLEQLQLEQGAASAPPPPPASAAAGLGGVVLLEVTGAFAFDPATHRDFLGAVLGTGVERDRVGDIVVLPGDAGAHVLLDPGVAPHVGAALASVRSVRVASASAVPLSRLRVAPPRADTVRSVEASLRLDAVASAGFRLARARVADLIDGGDVRLNWRSGPKPSALVKAGDVISVRGLGRLTVGSVEATKKERWAVELHRLL